MGHSRDVLAAYSYLGLLAARAILFSVTFSSGLRSGDLHVGLPALYSFAYLELELEATKMESLYSPLSSSDGVREVMCVFERGNMIYTLGYKPVRRPGNPL